MRQYKHLDTLPTGQASDSVIEGCAVFEGGGWRGVYTQGVIDQLMINDINLSCSIGVSAGALMAVNYLTGQIGRGPYITLKYRHDSRMVGWKAFRDNQGITGFKFMHEDVDRIWPTDTERFHDPGKRLVCVATSLSDGSSRYFEKDVDLDFWRGMRAGATVPFLSKPVEMTEGLFLDGGVNDPVPILWALNQNYRNIVVVKTRAAAWRQKENYPMAACDAWYHAYPQFKERLSHMKETTNRIMDLIDDLEKSGRIFVICPDRDLDVPIFCGDMEKLGDLYNLGRRDTSQCTHRLLAYLHRS